MKDIAKSHKIKNDGNHDDDNSHYNEKKLRALPKRKPVTLALTDNI